MEELTDRGRRPGIGGRAEPRAHPPAPCAAAAASLEVAEGGGQFIALDFAAQDPRMAEIRPVLGHPRDGASTQGKTVGGWPSCTVLRRLAAVVRS